MKHLPLLLFCVIVIFFIKKRFFDTTDYTTMLKEGGVIIDVRSSEEFLTGNIDNSLNIPLNKLTSNISGLKDKNQLIITCCASGVRSGIAKNILKAKGYNNVVNGGGWDALRKKIKQ